MAANVCMEWRPSPGPRSASGFTLVEMVVVMTIVGIVVAVGVPSLRTLVQSQRIKTASFELYASMTYARSEAVARNAAVTVTPVAGSWANGWTVNDAGGTVLRQQPAYGSITISGPASVTYIGTGRLSAAVTPFGLTASDGGTGSGRCLTVDLSGRPVSKTGACS